MGVDFRLLRVMMERRAYGRYVTDITHDGYKAISFTNWLKLSDERIRDNMSNTGLEKYYK